MRITTVLKYLVGQKHAIRAVASSPAAIPIGLLLVISAGLAREYDRASLIHEPWLLGVPIAVSMALALVICVLFYVMPSRAGSAPRLAVWRAYRTFLALFWMTAPLAWLYAIPFERLLPEAAAVEANLWVLALVAAWRVALMARAISVVLGMRAIAAFMVIMMVADAAVFIALSVAHVPLLNVMGGVAMSESETVLSNAVFMTQFFSVVTAPVWLIGGLAALRVGRPDWGGAAPQSDEAAIDAVGGAARGWLAHAAVAAMIAGATAAVIAQPEQVRRHKAEHLLRDGRAAEAIAFMSRFERDDFPPLWNPPPRDAYRERIPDLTAVAQTLAAHSQSPDWIRSIYARKLEARLRRELHMHRQPWAQAGEWLSELESDEKQEHRKMAELLLAIAGHDTLSQADREAIESIFKADAQFTQSTSMVTSRPSSLDR